MDAHGLDNSDKTTESWTESTTKLRKRRQSWKPWRRMPRGWGFGYKRSFNLFAHVDSYIPKFTTNRPRPSRSMTGQYRMHSLAEKIRFALLEDNDESIELERIGLESPIGAGHYRTLQVKKVPSHRSRPVGTRKDQSV